jgi:hypothetical protein
VGLRHLPKSQLRLRKRTAQGLCPVVVVVVVVVGEVVAAAVLAVLVVLAVVVVGLPTATAALGHPVMVCCVSRVGLWLVRPLWWQPAPPHPRPPPQTLSPQTQQRAWG